MVACLWLKPCPCTSACCLEPAKGVACNGNSHLVLRARCDESRCGVGTSVCDKALLCAGACATVHQDQSRSRTPPIEQSSRWHDRLASQVRFTHDSVTDGQTMLIVFAQETCKAYPRYLVDLQVKRSHHAPPAANVMPVSFRPGTSEASGTARAAAPTMGPPRATRLTRAMPMAGARAPAPTLPRHIQAMLPAAHALPTAGTDIAHAVAFALGHPHALGPPPHAMHMGNAAAAAPAPSNLPPHLQAQPVNAQMLAQTLAPQQAPAVPARRTAQQVAQAHARRWGMALWPIVRRQTGFEQAQACSMQLSVVHLRCCDDPPQFEQPGRCQVRRRSCEVG